MGAVRSPASRGVLYVRTSVPIRMRNQYELLSAGCLRGVLLPQDMGLTTLEFASKATSLSCLFVLQGRQLTCVEILL